MGKIARPFHTHDCQQCRECCGEDRDEDYEKANIKFGEKHGGHL